MKSINNTKGSHLLSCRVIRRPAPMKGWKKEVFWKVCALENLKCNNSNNLLGKIIDKKYQKSNCTECELVQEDCWSMLLKLQVIFLYSPEIEQLFWKTYLMATSVFYMLQCFSNTNTNNILIYLTHVESMLC